MKSNLASIEILRASLPRALDGAAIVPFPCAAQIRVLVEKDKILAARKLLDLALRNSPTDPALEAWRRVLSPPRVLDRAARANNSERTEEFQWFERDAEGYRGRWVAVEHDRLVAEAATLQELMSMLRAIEPKPNPIIHHIG